LKISDAKNSPQAAMGTDAAGVGHATSGSPTDQLTRQHRMTLDEAQLILNVKRGEVLEAVMKVRLSISLESSLGPHSLFLELRTPVQGQFTSTQT